MALLCCIKLETATEKGVIYLMKLKIALLQLLSGKGLTEQLRIEKKSLCAG